MIMMLCWFNRCCICNNIIVFGDGAGCDKAFCYLLITGINNCLSICWQLCISSSGNTFGIAMQFYRIFAYMIACEQCRVFEASRANSKSHRMTQYNFIILRSFIWSYICCIATKYTMLLRLNNLQPTVSAQYRDRRLLIPILIYDSFISYMVCDADEHLWYSARFCFVVIVLLMCLQCVVLNAFHSIWKNNSYINERVVWDDVLPQKEQTTKS